MTARREAWSWGVLAALLVAVLAGVSTFRPSRWPGTVGDEATYRMQAESLAWDGDLAYTPADLERYVALHGHRPAGLILQRDERRDRLVYGKPALYAVAVAPFVRAAPERGPAIANALFLAAAGVGAALALRRVAGPTAPLLVAAFLFASVAFGYAFWPHPDLLLMSCAALGLALAFGRGAAPQGGGLRDALTERRGRGIAGWAAAGAVLGLAGAWRPFYLALLAPAALAVPAGERRRALPALASGAAAVLAASALASWLAAGTWTPYAGERLSFYPHTGYPGVDFPADRWDELVAERGGRAAWVGARAIRVKAEPRLWLWNSVYFLAGEHVGILPYFLPVVLGFAGRPRGAARWALAAAAGVAAIGFLLLRPHNFYGGGGALANRYFLPLYPAFWFLSTRPVRARWVLAVALVAAPLLWPLWSQPRGFPLAEAGAPGYVSPAARRLLPYETTLSHLKPGGREDVQHGGLWVKFLDRGVQPAPEGGGLELAARSGSLLVGHPGPLAHLRIEVAAPAPAGLAVRGAAVERVEQREDGSALFLVAPDAPRARHSMWWGTETWWLYVLGFDAPAEAVPVTFSLRVEDP